MPTLSNLPTFWKHLLTVMSGSVAAQALPILAAPLITRLCTPAEMGAFSVWFGVVAIASVIATLRMENAMIFDQRRQRQHLCFSVVAWSATWLALLLTVAAAVAKMSCLTSMSWMGALTVGIAAWLTATMQTTLAYAASHNAFAPAAKARIVAAGGIALAQLGILSVGAGADALKAGHLIGLALGLVAARILLQPPLGRRAGAPAWRAWTRGPHWRAWRDGLRARALALLRRLSRHGLSALFPSRTQRAFLRTHRALWNFTLPANLLNTGVGQLPLLIIGARHGVMAAGLFALTQRVLAAPISLLAASVHEVFKRESVRQFQDTGNCRPAYMHALRVLLLLGCAPSLILLLASPALFAFAFGEAWRGAGELAQILAPLYFLNFLASPLSYVFFVAGRQKIELVWQIALFVMTVGVFAAPLTLKQNVLAYTIGYSLLYLLYLRMSYRYSVNRNPTGGLHAAR
ncbi:Membrane protein involved in the export of O-antigen and teichoic acid [Duganella sp. CF517]|uniref:oligosaccharide flippase family protein n=1 Tax=Duganella sp. CF517 TaxID=1881038 RepID=UPI0008BE811F|nr:oligosaccharide flippase family protein [Duganella sp. CF517]SEO05840.1 Membrane protein involved in the export of O-antigen and teichoic acid [Duganella sp. CF517]